MEIRQLRTFQVVAALMSFHGAAKALGYAQSTISAQIQNLEEDLGVRVFEREGRSIKLTDEGRRLLGYAEKMVGLEAQARAEMAGGGAEAEQVAIYTSEYFCTIYSTDILKIFSEYSENMQVDFRPVFGPTWLEELGKGEAQLGVVLGGVEGAAPSAVHVADREAKAELQEESLGEQALVLVGRRRLQLSGQLLVTDADLAGQTLLRLTTEQGCDAAASALLAARGVRTVRQVRVSSLSALLRLVAAGQGVAFIPRFLAEPEQQAGRLSILEWEGGTPVVELRMLRGRDAPDAAVRHCMDVIRNVAGK